MNLSDEWINNMQGFYYVTSYMGTGPGTLWSSSGYNNGTGSAFAYYERLPQFMRADMLNSLNTSGNYQFYGPGIANKSAHNIIDATNINGIFFWKTSEHAINHLDNNVGSILQLEPIDLSTEKTNNPRCF